MTIKAGWTFDLGDARDSSLNGHDGTVTGGVTFGAPAKVGPAAAQAPGTGGNRIDFPSVTLSGAWSAYGWVRPVSFPGADGDMSFLFGESASPGTGIRIKTRSGGTAGDFNIRQYGGLGLNADFTGADTLAPGVDHMWGVKCTGPGGDVMLYVDGVLVNTRSGWGFAFTPARMLADLSNHDYHGALDEPFVWDRGLSDAEFSALYNGGAGLSPYDPNFPDGPLPSLNPKAPAYARQLKALFPPGRAYDLEPGSVIDQTCAALSVELDRIDTRGEDLIDETDPRTADELLPDWERVLGLPDDLVTSIPATTAGRQAAITAKYVSRGGQDYDFFANLVKACGYTLASIDRFASARFTCVSYCNAPLYEKGYAYSMQLNINAPAGAALDHATTARIISRATHSHITAFCNFL